MPSPLDTLRSLLPTPPKPIGTPIDPAHQDQAALAAQSQDPSWKGKARTAFEGLVDFAKGALYGDPLNPDASKSNLAGQMLTAGLPLIGSTGIPGLYSRLSKAAEDLPGKSTAAATKSFLLNRAPQEEMDYRSLSTLLGNKQPQDVVPKGEVLKHLEENPLTVGVKTLGEETHYPFIAGGQDARADVVDPTKYQRYTLPGGENYRETLLTLNRDRPNPHGLTWTVEHTPTGTTQTFGSSDAARDAVYHLPDARDYTIHHPEEITGPNWEALQASDAGSDPYKSSHWDEPNVLVHVRHNERFLPNSDNPVEALKGTPYAGQDSRGRFLEEVQSDWHQQGREHGYGVDRPSQLALGNAVDTAGQRVYEFERAYEEAHGLPHEGVDDYLTNTYQHLRRQLADPHHDAHWDQIAAEYNQLQNAHNQAVQAYDEALSTRSAVPDAPFKEAWPDLALKQQVMDVAQRPDLNWLGFTSGQTQADRYNLSNHVSKLAFDHDPVSNTGILRAWDPQGREVMTEHLDKPEKLVDYIGKDAASRLIAQPPNPGGLSPRWLAEDETAAPINSYELTGQDLQVGGEGMKSFYDMILPNKLNKILKPFGGRVEPGEIPLPSTMGRGTGQNPEFASQPSSAKAWIAQLTPQMKAEILKKGLPLLMLMGLAHSPQSPQSSPPTVDNPR